MMCKNFIRLAGLFLLLSFISCSSATKLVDRLKTNPADIQRIRSMNRLEHTVALAPIILELTVDTTEVTNEKYLMFNTDRFADQLVDIFQTNNVFSKIEKISSEATSKKAQIKEARGKKASLLMNISIKKARLYYIGSNDSALGNTAMWFMLGVPSLWGADIDYGVEFIAEVSFLDVASSPDFATLIYSYECPFKVEGGLTYLERSSSMAFFVMPPQFCPDNLDKIETLILPNAQEQFLVKLSDTTKKEFQK